MQCHAYAIIFSSLRNALETVARVLLSRKDVDSCYAFSFRFDAELERGPGNNKFTLCNNLRKGVKQEERA